MGVVKWYKRDPNAALTGMASLTLEERGAYNTILDLIYAHDGAASTMTTSSSRAGARRPPGMEAIRGA